MEYQWPTGLSRDQWADLNWGLIHHATVYTDIHHDADGKVTLIVAEQGCKLWIAYYPRLSYTRKDVHRYFDGTLEKPPEDVASDSAPEDLNREDFAVGLTLVMLPGDC